MTLFISELGNHVLRTQKWVKSMSIKYTFDSYSTHEIFSFTLTYTCTQKFWKFKKYSSKKWVKYE